MELEKQFESGVRLMMSLPENGPYQPSENLILLLNSYHKQATLGPCNEPKPGFFEIHNKAQWNAWNSLGSMSKNEAMQKYVYEISKIVETMSFTPNVEEFLETLGPFYEYVKDENSCLDINANGTDKKEKIHLESFESLSSRAQQLNDCMNDLHEVIAQESSIIREYWESGQLNLPENFDQVSERSDLEGSADSTLPDFDETTDTEVFEDPLEENVDSGIISPHVGPEPHQCDPSCDQILYSLQKLRMDIDRMESRVSYIEKAICESKSLELRKNPDSSCNALHELSGPTTFLLAAWPFVVCALIGVIKYTSKN